MKKKRKQPKYRFSFKNFAKLIYQRQVKKDADTFIIIYGIPRTGKTTLGFNILIPYIKLMKKLHKEGKTTWQPEKRWSDIMKKYFASSSGDMNKKAKNNPDGSFTFIDEGADVVSWMDLMTSEQKELLQLIQKTGKKHMLTILITPSLGLLTKYILARAHYMFILLDEPKENGNRAYLLRNYKVPFLAEKQPFGLNKIIKDLEKNPYLAQNLDRYMIDKTRLVAVARFRKINDKLYSLYDKLVKEPSIMSEKKRVRSIPIIQYQKIKYILDTLLWRLYTNDEKSIAQIERLMTDKFGMRLASRSTIKNWIDKIMALDVKPKFSKENAIKVEKPIKVTDTEDIDIDDTEDID